MVENGNRRALLEEILRHRGASVSQVLESAGPWETVVAMGALTLVLGGIYGATVGMAGGWRQTLSSSLKMPAVLVATLAVCFPILYVSNVLLGAQLSAARMLALITGALAFHSVLLASWAPVCAFFSFGSGYHFLKLLHVAVYGGCGMISMAGLLGSMRDAAALLGTDRSKATVVFVVWTLIFGFVGTQMTWALRPLIGEPGLPSQWLRRREKGLNFYTAVLLSVRNLTRSKPPTEV